LVQVGDLRFQSVDLDIIALGATSFGDRSSDMLRQELSHERDNRISRGDLMHDEPFAHGLAADLVRAA
jgi:hypothetical protein